MSRIPNVFSGWLRACISPVRTSESARPHHRPPPAVDHRIYELSAQGQGREVALPAHLWAPQDFVPSAPSIRERYARDIQNRKGRPPHASEAVWNLNHAIQSQDFALYGPMALMGVLAAEALPEPLKSVIAARPAQTSRWTVDDWKAVFVAVQFHLARPPVLRG